MYTYTIIQEILTGSKIGERARVNENGPEQVTIDSPEKGQQKETKDEEITGIPE